MMRNAWATNYQLPPHRNISMKRILQSEMTTENGLLYHQGNLFSGVSYERFDDETVRAWLVQDGQVDKPYLSPYFDDSSDLLHVDLSAGMSDYEIPCYDGKPYSGVAYSFEKDYCEREALLIEGDVVSDTWWSKDGILLRYEQHTAGYGEIYEWYRDGAMNRCTITTSNSFFGALTFSQDGHLKGLSSQRGFFGKFSHIASKSPFFPVRDVSALFALQCAEEVWLIGEDIDDFFVGKMCEASMLKQTKNICIMDTSITDSGMTLLAKCPMLKNFDIQEKDVRRRQLLKAALAGMGSIQAKFS